jgi:hypothetical protein
MKRHLTFAVTIVLLIAALAIGTPATASHQWTLDSISCSGGSVTIKATHAGGSEPAVWIDIVVNGGFLFQYQPYDDSQSVPAGAYTFTLTDAAFAEGAVVLAVTSDSGPVSTTCAGFSGPGLPSKRNLVLITSSTAVLDKPGGEPTGRGVYTCQTVFVTDTDASGNYGEVFVMGGWIPLSVTFDVPEDYGQPNGTPIRPDCVGK